ncbi:MAG TPA: hypothetical protein VGL56_11865 [Fimbriimonadaceae bacterium]
MESVKLTIVGAASLRCGIPVIASLATYFGERPLEVSFYDADEERLELFSLFANKAFRFSDNPHTLRSSTDALEMLDGADRVVLQLDEHCARKENKVNGFKLESSGAEEISAALSRLAPGIANQAAVMSLLFPEVRVPLDYYYRLDWPGSIGLEERRSIPHQLLRWIREEEYLHDIFREFERSPLKSWLDDVSTAIVVSDAGG